MLQRRLRTTNLPWRNLILCVYFLKCVELSCANQLNQVKITQICHTPKLFTRHQTEPSDVKHSNIDSQTLTHLSSCRLRFSPTMFEEFFSGLHSISYFLHSASPARWRRCSKDVDSLSDCRAKQHRLDVVDKRRNEKTNEWSQSKSDFVCARANNCSTNKVSICCQQRWFVIICRWLSWCWHISMTKGTMEEERRARRRKRKKMEIPSTTTMMM